MIIAYILAFIQLYGIYKFNNIKNLMIIQKRYPFVVLMESIIVMIYLCIAFPGVGYIIFYQTPLQSPSLHALFTYCGYVIYPFTAHGIVISEFARLWLISYDLNYLNSSSNDMWKSKINPSQYDKTNNFYIKHKHDYGNQKWILKRFLIFYLIVASISSVSFNLLYSESQQIVQLIDGALYGISGFGIISLWCKSPKNLNDHFLFQYEFKITILLMVGANIIYVINQGLHFYDPYFATFTTVFIAGLSFCMVSMLSTLYIPQKIMKLANWDEINRDDSHSDDWHISLELYRVSSHRASLVQKQKKQEMTMKEKLLNVFAGESEDKNDIELFIGHLNEEFSLEIILSFIEFVQFRQYLSEISVKYNHVDPEQIGNMETLYSFSSSIPRSSIIYDHKSIPYQNRNDLIKFFKEIAYKLYEKYIVVSTEFEINISHQLRHWFQRQMNNKKLWINVTIDGDHGGLVQLIHIFDAAIDEMFYLQLQSFVRFNQL